MSFKYSPTVPVMGTPIKFGGINLIMPPLSLLALEQFQTQLKEMQGNPLEPQNISKSINICHAALLRNYPDITREEVGNHIGLENLEEVMTNLIKMSGLTATAEPEIDETGK